MKTENTARHVREIKTPVDFIRTVNAGAYAWPGGYPIYFITSDGEALSFEAAKNNLSCICDAIRNRSDDGWRVVGCEVNWEDGDLRCCHSGVAIESAYA